MAKEFNDGVCDNCGNTGLAGEKCIVCGGNLTKIDAGIVDPIVEGDSDDIPRNPGEEVYPLEILEAEENAEEPI